MIHPTAVVDPTAQVAGDVEIGPFCVVGPRAVLAAGVRLSPHAIVHEGCELGEGVQVDSFVVVGGRAQMRKPDPNAELGRVVIGARTVLREGVTVHRPSVAGGSTEIGPDCFFMAHSHIAHDCKIAAFVTLANNAMIAGHVAIGEHAFVGGGAGVHQFVRIGESAMVAGNAAISYDVPPFSMAADRNDICGLNLIGLRRRGFPTDTVADLKRCFRSVFLASGNLKAEAQRALAGGEIGVSKEGRAFLEFFVESKRGFGHVRRRRGAASDAAMAE